MKAYDEDAKYILFINKLITILSCPTVNSLTIGFLGHISQHKLGRDEADNPRLQPNSPEERTDLPDGF